MIHDVDAFLVPLIQNFPTSRIFISRVVLLVVRVRTFSFVCIFFNHIIFTYFYDFHEIASLRRLDSHFFGDWSLIAGFSFLLDFHCILASQKKKADGRLRVELRVSAHGED